MKTPRSRPGSETPARPRGGLSAPALSGKDREDLAHAVRMDFDWLAVSFVKSATDLHEARQCLRDLGSEIRLIAKVERVEDYGYRVFGVKGKTADELHVNDHVKVLNLASQYVDSACSKTCNVGSDITWEEFKDVYMQAFDGGASGCTTFRAAGKRYGILNAASSEDIAEEPEKQLDFFVDEDVKPHVDEGGACYFDPSTGLRSCE